MIHTRNTKTLRIGLFGLIMCTLLLLAALFPLQSDSIKFIRRKHVKALKKVAVAATVLGQRKKIMIPLPVPLPLPIPIINKHEPIISPIDPLLTLGVAKANKGFGLHGGYGGGGFGGGGFGGGIGGIGGYGRRR